MYLLLPRIHSIRQNTTWMLPLNTWNPISHREKEVGDMDSVHAVAFIFVLSMVLYSCLTKIRFNEKLIRHLHNI